MTPMTIEQAQAFASQHGLPFWVVLLFGSALPVFVYAMGLYAKRQSPPPPAVSPNVSQMIELLLSELARARQMLAAFQPQIDTLFAARFALLNVVSDLYGAAGAGRAMVHDLERQLGREETVFPPLPAIPLAHAEAPAADEQGEKGSAAAG